MITGSSNMWLIQSNTEKDFTTDSPLFWSNEDGWVSRESATRFSEYTHMRDGHAVEHMDAIWVKENSMTKQIQPTIFVVMGKWDTKGDPHIIALVSTREKALALCAETLRFPNPPLVDAMPVRRAEAWIEGEFWVQD